MSGSVRRRSVQLDLLRCFALFCVISVHFFLHIGFYDVVITGSRVYAMVFLRTGFMVCVPLFIMLTGYLVRSRDCSLKYYKKLIRILAVYLLASLCCALYNRYIAMADRSILQEFWGLFTYETAPYAWYIEMYIGLFLLTPFLNILYEALQTKKQRQYLLTTLLILTVLPSIANIWWFDDLSWWRDPGSIRQYRQLVPQWWQMLYPVTYFYLGRWLRDYPVRCGKLTLLGLNLLVFVLSGAFNCYRSGNTTLIQGPWQDFGSLAVTVQSVLVFALFCALPLENAPAGLSSLLARISDWSLGAYLVSWIFDDLLYPLLNAAVPSFGLRLNWFPVMVGIIFLLSTVLSALLNGIYASLGKAFTLKNRKVDSSCSGN